MKQNAKKHTTLTDRWTLFTVVGAYFVLSVLWILLSDEILRHLVINPDVMSHIAMLKGVLYVIVTTTILYLLFGSLVRKYRKAEKALLASEERFRTVADFTHDWEYWQGQDGRFIYVSPSSEKVTGYRPEEFIADAGLMQRIVHVDDRFLALESSLAATPRQTHTTEFRIITKDGRQRWIGHICQPVYGTTGEYMGRRASNRDITESKLAQEEIRTSRSLLKSIVEGTSDAVFVKDTQGRYMLINEAGGAVLGKKPHEIIGKDDTVMFPPEEAAAIGANDRHIMQSAKTTTFEETISTTTGLRTYLSTKGPIFDQSGAVAGLFGVVRDITERQRMEESLRVNEQKLSDAVELADLAYWECDLPAAMLIMNDRVYSMMGTTVEREGGYAMSVEVYAREFISPEDSHVVIDELMAARSSDVDTSRQFDCLLLRRDGRQRHVTIRYSITHDTAGHAVKAYGVIQDVTERKLIEETLRQSEQQFRAIFETTSIGMAQADPITGRFIRVNHRMCQITGYSAEELTTMTFSDITHPDERDSDWSEFERVRRGELAAYYFEKRYICKDGTYRWVSVNATVIRDADGRPIRSIAAIEDIDERKRAEAVTAARSRILEYSFANDMPALLRKVLDECEVLTSSSIAFFHFMLDDQETLSLQEWSTRTQSMFCTAKGKGEHYPISQAGIWADSARQRRSIIVNDYASMPGRKGQPTGHAEVNRYVSIPVFRSEKVVAIIGVGNKPIDYDEKDVEIVRQLADLSWDIAERKKAEEQVKAYRDHLEELVEQRTRQLNLALASGRFEMWVWTAADDLFTISSGLADIMGLDHAQRTISREQYRSLVHPDDINALTAMRTEAYEGRTDSFHMDYRIRHPQKGWIWVMVSVAVETRGTDGKADKMIGLLKDISEQREAEAQLRVYSEQLEQMVDQRTEDVRRQRDLVNRIAETSPTGIAAINSDGRIFFANAAAEKILGLTRGGAIDRAYNEPAWHITDHDGDPVPEEKMPFIRARDTRQPVYGVDFAITRPDNSTVCLSVSAAPLFTASGRFDGVVAAFEDVTARRNAQLEQELTIELLRIADLGMTTTELIQNAISFFHRKSGCRAIGIRLKNGDDYPYYQTMGFPDDFVIAERSLCLRDEEGNIVRDACGNPLLECMCGNIINGRFDPSLPFFTAHGSFWTNSTSELLAATSEADRQARTRNRCNGEGYESVALIPLHAGGHRLGLLQLNDSRKGRFSPETIALWERLADYLAVALAKLDAEEALKKSEARYRSLFDSMTEGFALHEMLYDASGRPCDYRFVEANPAFERLTGLDHHDILGKTLLQVLPNEDHEWIDIYGKVATTGQPSHSEHYYSAFNRHYEVYAYSPAAGQVATLFVDITVRKQAEEALRDSKERFRLIAMSTPDHITIQDADLRYQMVVNPQLGLTEQEMLGRTDHDIFQPKDAATLTVIKRKILQTGQSQYVNIPLADKAGKTQYFEGTYIPRRDPQGRIDGLLGYFRNITSRIEIENQLRDHRARLQNLASQLSLAEERERRRIAVLLHDNIGHNLTLAKMTAEEIAAAGARPIRKASMTSLVSLLEETINASSTLTFELSSPILYELGLEAALQWLTERTQKQHGLAVAFADDEVRYPISEERSVMLFQVAREMLFNVAKHAHATHAALAIRHGKDIVTLHVTDDGQGFDPEKVGPGKSQAGGFGIFSIRERLTSMGGELIIQSSPGCGTHVQVSVPYR